MMLLRQIFQALVLLLAHGYISGSNVIKKRIAVIGGGVGGLVGSALLSSHHHSVVLIEKNKECGGRMNSDILCTPTHQYRFDTGPSLLLLPEVYKSTFQLMGASLADHVDLLRVDPFYRCFFEEDSSWFDISTKKDEMKAKLDLLESGSSQKFEEYMQVAGAFLRFGLPNVIEEKFDLKELGNFIIASIRAFPLLSHSLMLKSFFKSAKLRALLSFQDLYIGLSPRQSPAVFSLLQALEFDEGIYYPKGGFRVIAAALEDIARKAGVEIHTNSEVVATHMGSDDPNTIVSITVSSSVSSSVSSGGNPNKLADSNNSHVGIPTNNDDLHTSIHSKTPAVGARIINTTLAVDAVVSNIDAPAGEYKLLSQPGSRDLRALQGRPSCGIASFHLALDRPVPGLTHHTLFLSRHYEASWGAVEDPDVGAFNASAFNFYVHAPSRTDDSVCPVGHDAITVLVPIPPLTQHLINTRTAGPSFSSSPPSSSSSAFTAINGVEDVDELHASIRSAVLRRMQSMVDEFDPTYGALDTHIVAESCRMPRDWRAEFDLFRGSAFGLAHSLDQLSLLRPRLRHPKVRNLYRVGASTRPGNGVPLVMIGARLMANTVIGDLLKQDPQTPQTQGPI